MPLSKGHRLVLSSRPQCVPEHQRLETSNNALVVAKGMSFFSDQCHKDIHDDDKPRRRYSRLLVI